MSEITKPIALDESLHTTEPTPRNLADVLSDELQNLATAISGGSDKVPKTDIATVEPTNTASRAYSVGELVYVNGNLYKVITAITIGATFTVGTNIQSANVSGTVKDALDNRTSFIDTSSSAIASITTIGGSWTATQDCWAVARARKEDASAVNPQIYLGSIVMVNVLGVDYGFVVFPVKKGQTVSTRDVTNVVYNVVFYPTV